MVGAIHSVVGLGLTMVYGTDEKPRLLLGIFFWAFVIEVVVGLVRGIT